MSTVPTRFRLGRFARSAIVVAALVTGSLAVSAVPASAVPASGTGCAAAHVIAARGSNEPAGPGRLGPLVSAIQNGVGAPVSASSVSYPASALFYSWSTTQGDAAIKKMLTVQVTKCPTQAIVLVGFSQGAQLVGDVLSGGGGAAGLGSSTPPAAADVTDNVVAAIQMADPRHVANVSINVGTGNPYNGLFPRTRTQNSVLINGFSAVVRSYCDAGDPYCARGRTSSVHDAVVGKYSADALAFTLGRLSLVGVR